MFFYKIDKKTKDEMRAELARRRLAIDTGAGVVAESDGIDAVETAEQVEPTEQDTPENEQE